MVHFGLLLLHSRYVENTWSNNYLHTLYFSRNNCILKWVLPGLSIPPGFGIQKRTSQKSFERTQEQMNKRNWGFAEMEWLLKVTQLVMAGLGSWPTPLGPQCSILFFAPSLDFLEATTAIILQKFPWGPLRVTGVRVSLVHCRRKKWTSTTHQQGIYHECRRCAPDTLRWVGTVLHLGESA